MEHIDWNAMLMITVPLVLTGVGAVIGYFINYLLHKKAEFSSRNADKKREAYQDYVNFIISFFENPDEEKDQKETNITVYDIYKRLILYGSPEVIESYGEFFQLFYKNSDTDIDIKQAMSKMTSVFAEMRKDIGLSNKFLGQNGVRMFRPILQEFDELMTGQISKTINMKSKDSAEGVVELNRQQRRSKKGKKS